MATTQPGSGLLRPTLSGWASARQHPATLAVELSRPRLNSGGRGDPTYQLLRHLVYLYDACLRCLSGADPRNLIVSMPPRHGKALALDTPVPTPTGWTTMGEIRVGDSMFDDRGKPCRVTWVSPVWTGRQCYEVRSDSGEVIVADAEHEWRAVLDRKHPVSKIHTTATLARPRKKRAMIERQLPLDLPDADLPLDPYVLGAWLGDGSSNGASLTCGLEDFPHMQEQIRRAGLVCCRSRANSMSDARSFTFTARDRGKLGSLTPHSILRRLGLLGNKHIPQVYLRASAAQRLALLQGLIDTDGHVSKNDGQIEFCSTRRELAEGVRELVCSLGRKASLIEGDATLKGRFISKKYRVLFYMKDAARLPRKREHTRDVYRTPNHYVSAHECASVPTVCIEVDSPSHMFLAGRSMIPTHNSISLSQWLMVWLLECYPHLEIILASYGANFASEWGQAVRDTIADNDDRLTVQLRPDSKARDSWKTTAGGRFHTAGAGGSIVGRGANVLVVDDPVKGWEQVTSQHQRDKMWSWWQAVAGTRLQGLDGRWKRAIVVLTRWHHDDIAARILANAAQNPLATQWRVVNLPAIAGEGDELGREVGEALCRYLFDEAALAEIEANVGPLVWASQYQGQPIADTGRVFRDSDWRRYRIEGGMVDCGGDRTPLASVTRFGVMDLAITEDLQGDWTVLALWGVTWQRHLVLLDVVRERVGGPAQLELIRRAVAERGAAMVGVEAVNYQRALTQHALDLGLPVESVTPDRDKVSRAWSAAILASQGRIWIPEPGATPWVDEWVQEHREFPNGKHDDQVDTTSYAVELLPRVPVGAHGSPVEDFGADLVGGGVRPGSRL